MRTNRRLARHLAGRFVPPDISDARARADAAADIRNTRETLARKAQAAGVTVDEYMEQEPFADFT